MNPLQFPGILGSNQVSDTSKDSNMPDSNITPYQPLVYLFHPEENLVQQRWINEAAREPEPKNFDFVAGIPSYLGNHLSSSGQAAWSTHFC